MARQSFPTAFVAEVRGVSAPSEFTDRSTGELVKLGPVVKLERELEGGADVETYELRINDSVASASDVVAGQLKRGALVEVHGDAVIGGGNGGYFRLHALRAYAA
jgi:hypothetical protein